jgi:crotonobetainyl-CoA:carnitine CoA-transferase CaiB-like acyl-CoA transferase
MEAEPTADPLPLQGVRVLEIGGGIPAAFATRWLTGFGADVVRVEPETEALTPDESVYLLPGKRRTHATDDALATLARAAAIIVEDGPPGALAARGLDPSHLRREHPSLVVVSITPYGQDGPYAPFPATNITAFAMGGIMSLTGMHQREPLVTGGSQALYLGGLDAAGAAITAWFGALVHGEGDWVDISLQESMAGMLELYGPRGAYEGSVSVRSGNHVRAVWGLYPCADGFAGVCALERQVPALFALLGDPELDEPHFRDPLERPNHDDALQAKLYDWFGDRTRAELLELGVRHRVPIGAVATPLELLENPSLRERGFFDTVETPAGPARIPGRPFLGLPWRAGKLTEPVPADAILAEWSRGQ